MGKKTDTKAGIGGGEFLAEIVEHRSLSSEHKSMVLALAGTDGRVFASAAPGQFINVACRDLTAPQVATPLLRRPFSIAALGVEVQPCGSRSQRGDDPEPRVQVEFIYQIVGTATKWLARRVVGEQVNILGPLGRGFTLPEDTQTPVLLVGGGVGLPPLFFLAQRLRREGFEKVIGFAGARSQKLFCGTVCLEEYHSNKPLQPQRAMEQFNVIDIPSVLATDDGSCGFAGLVVEAVERFLGENRPWQNAHLCACGPEGMLKGVAQLAQRRNLACQVCVEAYMACGIGLCQSCVVRSRVDGAGEHHDSKIQYKLTCTDGPVFDYRDIVW